MRRTQISSEGEEEAEGWRTETLRSSTPADKGCRGPSPPQRPRSSSASLPLRGRSSVGLVIASDWDAALAAAGFTPPHDLWPSDSQQAVSCQGAGDCWLVNTGGEAVAAVKLTRDVTVVVLENSRINDEKEGRFSAFVWINLNPFKDKHWFVVMWSIVVEVPSQLINDIHKLNKSHRWISKNSSEQRWKFAVWISH